MAKRTKWFDGDQNKPLFGNTSGKKAGTHWMVFMKPKGERGHD